MTDFPTGTVTFLLTDLEKSTQQWERFPEAMNHALARHDAIMRDAIVAHGGVVVKTTGDGFLAAYDTSIDALQTALAAQRALAAESWGDLGELRIRVGIHAGIADLRNGDYFGPTLNRTARLMAAGHGEQVLLSQVAQELSQDHLPDGAELVDLGEHRLKDLVRPERIYQLRAPGLKREFPPLRTLDRHPNNLPAQPTPFLGRESEVEAVCNLLLEEDVRLLTLTGIGGTGKTRLSLQAAAELLESFADGVYFIPLAAITEPAQVLQALAEELGLRETEHRPVQEVLHEALRDKQMLLVFDNFEQVLEAGPLVADLLSEAPKLEALVTSRSALRVSGEQEYPVAALSVPDPRRMLSLERLSQYAAVQLFLDRAQAVKHDFTLTRENVPAIAEICYRLDGLPLAIELAAARTRLFTPQAMLPRLERRFTLLTGGAKDLPARQQTLRNAMAWSYDLLEESEKRIFRRLAVFSGGCSLEAAEAVCAGDADVDVLEGLDSLVGKSLVRSEESGGEPRFTMLQTVHEFSRDLLRENGEEEDARQRHLEYFVDWVHSEATQSLPEAERGRALDRELDNIRCALERCKTNELGVESGVRLLSGMGWYWWLKGKYAEGRRHMEELAASPGVSPLSRANTLQGAGFLAGCQAETDSSVRLLEQSVSLFREIDDSKGLSWAIQMLGASVARQGNAERARELFEECLERFRTLGIPDGIAWSLSSLADLAEAGKEDDRVEALLQESLTLFRQVGDVGGISSTLFNLGELAQRQGDLPRAISLFRQSLEQSSSIEATANSADALRRIGELTLLQGDTAAARTAFEESWELSRDLDNPHYRWLILKGLAELARAQGQRERSARLFGALETSMSGTVATKGAPGDLPVAMVEEIDVSLKDEFPEAWQAGSAMSLVEAVAEGLKAEGT